MKTRLLALVLAMVCLTGCASLLEREYSTVEPHSSKFWESEAADTLRAENYQDLVNDLLILVGQHKESATVRLYHFEDDLSVTDAMERAAVEVQQETPLGSYAVEYITSSSQKQRGYYEVFIQIGYRRSMEQIQSVVSATSAEAVYSLLGAAMENGRRELAVRISYWGTDGQEKVDAAVARLREEHRAAEDAVWLVNNYPANGTVGLVEFLLEPTEEQVAEAWSAAEETGEETELSEGAEEGEKEI